MKKHNKRRNITLTCVIILAIATIIYLILLLLGSHQDLYADRNEGKLGMLPLSGIPIHVEVTPDISFKFDTGSDASSITEEDLEKLKKLGFKIEKKFYPVIGRNGAGKINWTFTRYRVDIPLYDYDYFIDSTGNIAGRVKPESLNVLHNVDLVLSTTGFSVLGVDFIEKFKVEYRYDEKAIGLYFNSPEGYEPFVDLTVSRNPIKDLWQSNRYYFSAKVQNITNDYFLDTGLQRTPLKLPKSDASRTRNDLIPDTAYTQTRQHAHPALIDRKAWVMIGDRAGTTATWYYDTSEEPYSANPFNFIKQDFVLDLKSRKIMLHPFSSSPSVQ